ncbi:hypothetical protein SAMN06264364_107140 [Quadrisphaera granulorum]|uniref:Uncharacterized protein n=1 Tax=Quadrisphaera granulorum TaxID=317664 RepID=A0A316AC37_9ACTN|nr:hypothetical protein BXY45_107140 [Quadrisphaera granulorum]SZE96216.1 hypothetical protein SAMN06264364_107140 [Quadrisphaera granulorum]
MSDVSSRRLAWWCFGLWHAAAALLLAAVFVGLPMIFDSGDRDAAVQSRWLPSCLLALAAVVCAAAGVWCMRRVTHRDESSPR